MAGSPLLERRGAVCGDGPAASVAVHYGDPMREQRLLEEGLAVVDLSHRDVLRHNTRLERTTCAEAMTVAPITCSPATPVARVAALPIEHKIDSMPVLSETGKLVGLVTSSDLLGLLIEQPQVNRLPFDFQVRVAEPQELAALA